MIAGNPISLHNYLLVNNKSWNVSIFNGILLLLCQVLSIWMKPFSSTKTYIFLCSKCLLACIDVSSHVENQLELEADHIFAHVPTSMQIKCWNKHHEEILLLLLCMAPLQ
jgi:hypothetical protein